MLRVAGWVLAGVGVLVAAGGFFGVRTHYRAVIPGGASMEPGRPPGRTVLFTKGPVGRPHRGDVVLIQVPGRYRGEPVIQRVIGVGGDRVAGDRRGLTLNGRPLREPYVLHGDAGAGSPPYAVTVPAGRLFLLGDHRADSLDSRFFLSDRSGTVPVSAVRGRAVENQRVPLLLALGSLLSGALVLAGGVGCLIAGYVMRGRRRAGTPAPVPW
ncbi:signal peptidase I [Streptomyces fuscigenes]|uniref:signal peptidase I n=1 Tax=Streptomyces fuscigenes TaxID=1528880 RepID=UPI001F3EE9A2|nr:signal peptidase I [Streptomyces fuscigenes]